MWNLLADTSQLLTQHGSNVSSLAVRGDGRLVASIADDEAVVWDAHSGELVARFEVRYPSRVNSVLGLCLAVSGSVRQIQKCFVATLVKEKDCHNLISTACN